MGLWWSEVQILSPRPEKYRSRAAFGSLFFPSIHTFESRIVLQIRNIGSLAAGGDDDAANNGKHTANSLDEGHGVMQDEQGEDGGKKRDGLRNGGHFPGLNIAQSHLLDDVAEAEVGNDIGRQDNR